MLVNLISPCSPVLYSQTKNKALLQIWDTAAELQTTFAAIDRLVAANLSWVQQAFATAQVGPHHFAGSTGYGHGDLGRDALDKVYILLF